jgi:hypothetical protein
MDNYPDYETVEYHLIYSELIKVARHRGTVSYQSLAILVGLPTQGSYMGKRLGQLLGAVAENETDHGRPMLSALAVNVQGSVSEGFFTLARELNLLQEYDDPDVFLAEVRFQCYETWQPTFYKPK